MRGGVKKPSLKKKVTVKVGKKAVIKLKNGKKEAKVSWKTSKKSVVKILKKKTKTKGNKACAVIKGVSEGKAKITAVYKLGKKVTRLKCTVTVKTKGQTQDIPQDPSIIIPKNTDVPTAGPGGTATDVPDVTDKPATEAPKTDAPPTVKPTDAPDRPTVTNDPYASELVVPMTKANQAFAAEEATYNEDGTVSVALSPADSGHGICFYLNAEKLSVDLTDYKELVIAYNSNDAYEMAISLKEYIPDTAAESYWDGADSSKCPIVGSEQYTTFSKGEGEYRLDISSIKETAGGVFIKYNTYNAGDAASLPDAEMTIKSIKLIKDPATVSTQPPATEEPGPGTSEEPGTSAEPDTSEEPGTTDEPSVTEDPYADLKVNINKANEAFMDAKGTAEYNEDGTVSVALSSADSGHGICFYLNDAHTSVDLSQYKSLEISYETEKAYEMAVSLKGEIPAGAATDYWSGADSSKCPIVGSEQYTTFSAGSSPYTLNLSGIKDAAQGVFIKYNTYQKEDTADPLAEIKIKSITLVRDVTVAPPTTEPTKDPEATEAPTEAPAVTKVTIDTKEGTKLYSDTVTQLSATVSGTGNYSTAVEWSIEPAVEGIRINKTDGKVTIDKDVQEGTSFTVKAVSKSNPEIFGTVTLGVRIPKVTGFIIYAGDRVDRVTEIEPGTSIKIYTEINSKDGKNPDTTINLSIEPEVPGCSIDAGGNLTVGANVAGGTEINIVAIPKSNPSLKKTLTLTVKAPEVQDYTLDLTEANKAYSTIENLAFTQEGIEVTAATNQQNLGLYLNADKSGFDFRQYEAIKVCAKADDGSKVSMTLSTVLGMTDTSSKYGGGTQLWSKAVTQDTENTECYYLKTGYMTAKASDEDKLQENPVALDISFTTKNKKITITSITFLKEHPYESENLVIEMTKENLAYTNVSEDKITFRDGECEVKLGPKDVVAFYIKPDKSAVNLDYASIDCKMYSELGVIGSAYFANVGDEVIASKEDLKSKIVGNETSVSCAKTSVQSCWKANTISSFEIPVDNSANVICITKTTNQERQYNIQGMKLCKRAY